MTYRDRHRIRAEEPLTVPDTAQLGDMPSGGLFRRDELVPTGHREHMRRPFVGEPGGVFGQHLCHEVFVDQLDVHVHVTRVGVFDGVGLCDDECDDEGDDEEGSGSNHIMSDQVRSEEATSKASEVRQTHQPTTN